MRAQTKSKRNANVNKKKGARPRKRNACQYIKARNLECTFPEVWIVSLAPQDTAGHVIKF